MRLLLPLLLLSSVALAQPGALLAEPLPPRGVTLPPTSVALVDEATALAVNPAALRRVGGAQLFYLHERNLVRDSVADGLLAGASLLGMGQGLGVEWVRGRNAPAYRKLSLGLALGSPVLSLGGTWHTYGSEDGDVERLSSLDVGLSWRPARAFSLGAVVRNVDAPVEGRLALARTFDVGVGLRPFGERYSLGVDYLFQEGGLDAGRLSYTLQAELLPGLRAGAGLSHAVAGEAALAGQLALTVDTERTGLTYAAGGGQGAMGHVLAVRLSREPYRGLGLNRGAVALVDVNDALSGGAPPLLELLGADGEDPFLRLMRWLEVATQDERLRGVVLKLEGMPGVGWGRAEELRQAVLRLRTSGKRVMALLLSCDDTCYLVASAADEVYALPEATLPINGLVASVTSFGGTMEKLGVHWDVARVGLYKTAPEQLVRSDMSEAQRETLNAWLDTQVSHYEAAVAAGRGLPVERLREAWTYGLLTGERARALGLVDGVLAPVELDRKVAGWVPGASYEPRYAPRAWRAQRWGRTRRLAVVPVLGTIAGGKSREDPLGMGRIAGAETVVGALQRAAADPRVAAIILRVDSGGGDVLASDLMYRAVLEAKKRKPVIASMGDVAASGGYYAAMGAHEVLAAPTTLTGSIGVFALKPAVRELGQKLGAHQETILRAPLADMFELWSPWTPAQQLAAQAWVENSYESFITQVAASRGMDKARVDAIARGRVWAGLTAKELGLVDRLGGLVEALGAARVRAGLAPDEPLDVVVYGEPRGLLASLGGEPGVLAGVLPPGLLGSPAPVLPEGLRALVAGTGLASPVLLEPGLKALLPFSVSVH